MSLIDLRIDRGFDVPCLFYMLDYKLWVINGVCFYIPVTDFKTGTDQYKQVFGGIAWIF